MDTARMRACAALLPEPGDAVVLECLGEIDRLRAENDQLLALIQRHADACRDCKGNGAYIDKDGMWERCFLCADLRDALRGGEER